MDRLRRECPWDAGQTHASLVPHLLEEPYEALAAFESGDEQAFCEELGDVPPQALATQLQRRAAQAGMPEELPRPGAHQGTALAVQLRSPEAAGTGRTGFPAVDGDEQHCRRTRQETCGQRTYFRLPALWCLVGPRSAAG